MKYFEKWVKKIITPENLALFLTYFYFLSLLPVLYIARYAFPSADDYTNGVRCYQAWNATHSLVAVLKEAFDRVIWEYTQWRGCFTSAFLSTLPPNIWGEHWYGLTTLIVIAALTVSVPYFLFRLLGKFFKADKYSCLSISMLILIMLVQCMRPQERTELLYWYSGAINYTFIFSLELFFLGMLITIAWGGEKRKILRIVPASILGFLVGGGNQMSALNALIIVATIIFFITISKKWKNYKALIIPMGFCVLGAILSFAAPGNHVRAQEPAMSPFKAVFVSFYYCLDLGLSQWITWPIIFMILIMIPLFWNIAKKVDFKFPCPILALTYGYCVTSAMFTPSLYALGNIGAGRIQGLTYCVFILMLTLSIGYTTGWIQKKYAAYNPAAHTLSNKLSADFCWWILSCMFFLGFASIITVIPEPHYFTMISAVTDIRNGQAAGYARELNTRITLYQNGSGEDVIINELEHQPKLLFFSDLKPDTMDWENLGVARYYELNSVTLQKRDMQ